MIINNEKGFGIIEILIVSTISIIVLLSIASYLSFAMKMSVNETSKVESLYYAKSQLEQARALRDEDWDNLSTLILDTDYYFQESGANPEKWSVVAGEKTAGKYVMKIKFSQVNRDINDDIKIGGGTLDANTLKATSTVSYSSRDGMKQVVLFEYLTNFK